MVKGNKNAHAQAQQAEQLMGQNLEGKYQEQLNHQGDDPNL